MQNQQVQIRVNYYIEHKKLWNKCSKVEWLDAQSVSKGIYTNLMLMKKEYSYM